MQQVSPALGFYATKLIVTPTNPGLYERLAVFLDQNNWAPEEEVYRRAIAHFSEKSWYHKLARY